MGTGRTEPSDGVLAAFAAVGAPGEPLTTAEVADHLDCSRRHAYDRLSSLADRGAVETKKAGARARVWWRPDGSALVDALRRERRLTERLLETAPIGIAVLEPDGTAGPTNDRAAELLGVPEGAMDEFRAGERSLLDDGEPRFAPTEPAFEALATGEPVHGREVRVETAEGPRWLSVNATPIVDDDGAVERVVSTGEDVTRLKEQARRLERERDDLRRELDHVLERIDDGVVAVDEAGRFTYVNDRAAALLDAAESDLVGRAYGEVDAAALPDRATVDRAIEAGETVTESVHVPALDAWLEYGVHPSGTGASIYLRDVSDREHHERTLRALYDSARSLLDAERVGAVDDAVVDAAADVLDLPGVALYRHDADRDVLFPAAHSLDAGFMREELPTVPADGGSLTAHVFSEGATRLFDDITDSEHLARDAVDTEMRGGLFVPMGEVGIIVVGSREPGGIDADVTRLVELLATNAEAAYARVERERELARQRERLAALDDLNGVVRGINEAVIEQSTREEIERTVCESLAAADAYEFAWMAAVDGADGGFEPRAEAGVEGYIAEVPLSVDADDPTGRGPAGRAVRTGEMQVARDVATDPAFEPWRERALAHGVRASAAIPVAHDGTMYGVLGVYAARDDAFTGEERDVVGQLGDVVGHAIAAVERKRALLTDEMVEVSFRLPDVFEAFDAPDRTDARISLERTVPVGDGEYVEYGTADPAALDALAALVESVPGWADLQVLEERPDAVRFRFRHVQEPLVASIADRGGHVETAVVEDGEFVLTVQLPPTVDVRGLVDEVAASYPDVELAARRQVARPDPPMAVLASVYSEELTERQRAALAAAVYAGFFEWPRASSGEEVAASLGVTAPTFHQHLRAAERTLLSALLADRPAMG